MDQVKIGKFIAECRKRVNLTQAQLAQKLGITDRAVSKWETGRAMPDSSIMLELCSILKIDVADLLYGEVVTVDDYKEKYEETLLLMVREKEKSDRLLLLIEWIIGILSVLVLLIPAIVASYVPFEKEWIRVLVALSGFLPCFVGCVFALRIEQIAGYYECRVCGHKYVPSYRAILFATHIGRTRHLKCPKCQKRSWQKKVITKE